MSTMRLRCVMECAAIYDGHFLTLIGQSSIITSMAVMDSCEQESRFV